MLPHHIEIVHFGGDRDFLRQHLICGSATPPLVVLDEAEGVRQSIQIGQEVAVIEIRAAVEDDDGLPLADIPTIERCPTHRNTAFVEDRGLKCPRAKASPARSAAARVATMPRVFMDTPYRSCAVGAVPDRAQPAQRACHAGSAQWRQRARDHEAGRPQIRTNGAALPSRRRTLQGQCGGQIGFVVWGSLRRSLTAFRLTSAARAAPSDPSQARAPASRPPPRTESPLRHSSGSPFQAYYSPHMTLSATGQPAHIFPPVV